MWDVEPCTLDLSDVVTLSDEDLLKICSANPDLRIERNTAGRLEIMSPSGSSSSACEGKFVIALGMWNEQHGEGIVFNAGDGFHLPNGAVRATEAAWVRRRYWDALTTAQQDTFAPVVPEFIVDVRSPGDRLPTLRRKMDEWIQNGCRLAWLIDSIHGQVSIYRAGGAVEELGIRVEILNRTDRFRTLPVRWWNLVSRGGSSRRGNLISATRRTLGAITD